VGTEWALEPTGNQLVGPTGTPAHRALGTICPRSAVGRPYGTRLRLRYFRVPTAFRRVRTQALWASNGIGLRPKIGLRVWVATKTWTQA